MSSPTSKETESAEGPMTEETEVKDPAKNNGESESPTDDGESKDTTVESTGAATNTKDTTGDGEATGSDAKVSAEEIAAAPSNKPPVDVEDFVARWKHAIEFESPPELEKIYSEIVDIAGEHFSIAIMKDNKMDKLLAASLPISKTTKGKEAKKVLKETTKEKKEVAKAAKKAAEAAAEKETVAEAKARAEEEMKQAAQGEKRKQSISSKGQPAKKQKTQGSAMVGDLGIKTRIKPEKVVEVSNKIIEELTKNHTIGIKEIPLDTLAVRVGYKNARSDAVADAMKLLNLRGTVEKSSSQKVKLTQNGIDANIEEEDMQVPDNPEALVDMYWTQFETRLKVSKKGSGANALAAAERIWELLKDGQGHDMEEVLQVAGYKVENSHAMEEIKRQLRLLELAVKENKQLKFTDKVLKPLSGDM